MPLVMRSTDMTEEEYIVSETESEERHEYINGNLIAMPGESDINNEIAANILILLRQLLKAKGYSVYMEGVKVKIPGEPTYFYPDVFATKETTGDAKQYIKHEPELIAEVLSDTTRKYDLVDKFIAYQKISSLNYYLVVEPEKVLIQLFYKKEDDWEMMSFTNPSDVIGLSRMQIQFTVKDVYQPE